MAKVTFVLGELTCPSCLTKIKAAVSKEAGVQDVKVLFNAGKVKADIDPDKTSAQAIAQVISQLGYEVKSSKTIAEA